MLQGPNIHGNYDDDDDEDDDDDDVFIMIMIMMILLLLMVMGMMIVCVQGGRLCCPAVGKVGIFFRVGRGDLCICHRHHYTEHCHDHHLDHRLDHHYSHFHDQLVNWEHHYDDQVPLSLFSGECAEKDISFVGAIYEDFPDPGERWCQNLLRKHTTLMRTLEENIKKEHFLTQVAKVRSPSGVAELHWIAGFVLPAYIISIL